MTATGKRRVRRKDADRRRREVLEAANEIVMRDGPEVSMSAIAEEAGVPKPSLYRQFGNKTGLYQALATQHAESVLDACLRALDSGPGRRARLEGVIDAYLATIEERPSAYRFLMHPAGEAADADRRDEGRQVAPLLHRLGEALARVARERLELGPGADLVAGVWGHGVVGMLHGAGEWWQEERPCGRAELVSLLADLLCLPLGEAADQVIARDDPPPRQARPRT